MEEHDDEPEAAPADAPEPEPSNDEPAAHHPATLDWVTQRRYGSSGPSDQ
jgi:hypothetical protein